MELSHIRTRGGDRAGSSKMNGGATPWQETQGQNLLSLSHRLLPDGAQEILALSAL